MQGDEWKQARCGKVTASRFSDVLAKIKTGEAATRANYKAEIVAERLTGKPMESYTSREMQWGIDHEPFARQLYSLINEVEVKETGLIEHPTMKAGASPDGLVGTDGLIEIKCPNSATHIKTILSGKAPNQYIPQMQGQMWLSNRKWCDFISYDPRMDDKHAYFSVRVYKDENYIRILETAVTKFLEEVDQLIERLG